jgi:hypothetical protein
VAIGDINNWLSAGLKQGGFHQSLSILIDGPRNRK